MNKKFAIFDMDGTLIDSMRIWENLGCEYLKSKGITQDLTGLSEEIASMTMSESASLFVRRFSLAETAETAAAEMNAMMNAHYKNDIPLKRNVKAYLRQLQADGVHICVASATAKPLMEACLKRLGIRSCFDFILSCEDMNTSKREPAVYLEAARRFGTVSENIAVYEDVLYAVQTAKNANFHTVAVYDEASDSDWEEICRIADETVNFN